MNATFSLNKNEKSCLVAVIADAERFQREFPQIMAEWALLTGIFFFAVSILSSLPVVAIVNAILVVLSLIVRQVNMLMNDKSCLSNIAKARLSLVVKADRLEIEIVNLSEKLNTLNNANVDKSARVIALFGASFI